MTCPGFVSAVSRCWLTLWVGVPWYIKRSPANQAALAAWDYDTVEVELVEAKGPVNSAAPGGVEE